MIDLKNYGYTEIEAIQDGLTPGKTAVFLSMSAVGKSSLVNANRTGYLIDKNARNETLAIRSKQTKKNGGSTK